MSNLTDTLSAAGVTITPHPPDADASKNAPATETSNGQGPSITAQLIAIVEQSAELFHDAAGECYASVLIAGHRETHKLTAKPLKDWMAGELYARTGRAAGADKLSEAIAVLRAMARYQGAEIETHIRVAAHGGAIYLDLCDAAWRQVEITAAGWEVMASASSPVRFRRAGGTLALPEPVRGGDLCALRALLNLATGDERADEAWALILAWLVAAYRPSNKEKFSYPVLAIHGEQGSAKSTTCRTLRRLIDPNKSDLRSAPRDERDLAIAADHGRVLAFDNLTHISESLSNALCRLSTGGGFATRELHSDEGEIIFDAQRPIVLNGIAEVVSKSDLLDRSILVYLPTILPGRRKLERQIEADFRAAQPAILGALLDAVSAGLRRLDAGITLTELPRLADFYEWAVACEKGLGLPAGAIERAYRGNIASANDLAIEASPVAQAIVSLMGDVADWTGTTAGLLKLLTNRLEGAGENPARKPKWPQTARKLGADLKEISPNLRRKGIAIAAERGRAGYQVTITRQQSPPAGGGTRADNVHNVRDVHGPNGINGLKCEHMREHCETGKPPNLHGDGDASPREYWGEAGADNVHANVHPLNHSKQRAGEHVNIVNVVPDLPGARVRGEV